MELIIALYIIFCITTVGLVMHEVVIPLIEEVFTMDPKPTITKSGSKPLVYTAFAIASFIFAPAMFVIYLSPKLTIKFRELLSKDLKSV